MDLRDRLELEVKQKIEINQAQERIKELQNTNKQIKILERAVRREKIKRFLKRLFHR